MVFCCLAATAAEAPRLADLVRKAKFVGIGRVESVEDLDYGRIRVHRLVIEEGLKPGNAPSARSLRVVALADQPGSAVVDAGSRGVAFVQPLKRNSYFDLHLTGDDSAYRFVDGRNGWLQSPSAERLEEIAAPVRQIIAQSRKPAAESAARRMNQRSLVFAMLAAPHPLLVQNGSSDLASIAGLADTLTEPEAATLAACLSDPSLPLPVRESLIDQIANLGLRQMVGPLQKVGEPELQEHAWAALRQLGSPVSDDDLRLRLTSPQASLRVAAARELLERDGEAAIPLVAGTSLRDADKEVRLAAIEALGETGSPQAIAPLEGAFASEDVDERQATARALREIGGAPAADALHRLAFAGSIDAQRYAVVVLTLDVGRDDPRVRDIASRHSDAKIQEILEHGLEAGHGH